MGSALSSIDQNDYPRGPSALQTNADWTLGPLFAGWICNIFLCGIVVSWAGRYFVSVHKDRKWIQAVVGTAVLAECATAAFNAASIVLHGKDQDRTNAEISLLETADALSITSGAICAAATQIFFSLRVYRLLPRRGLRYPFAFAATALILAAFAGSLGITIVELINHGRTDETRGARPGTYELLYLLAEIWLWTSCAVDGLISALLIVRLGVNRNELNRHSSQNDQAAGTSLLLGDFMRLAFECAIVTMLCATTGAITYVLTTETTNLSYAFTNTLPALYTLSLLWAVNATHRLRQEVQHIDPSTLVQLVWNLADEDENAAMREQRLAELARGEGLAVTLRKSAAPRKAVKQLGHEINLLTIDRMTMSHGSEERSPRVRRTVEADHEEGDKHETDCDSPIREQPGLGLDVHVRDVDEEKKTAEQWSRALIAS